MIIEIKDQEIIKKGVESIIDFYCTMAVDQLHFPGLDAFVTGVDSSSLNVVLDTQGDSTCSAQTVATIKNFFNTHQVPWGWFVTPSSETSEVEKYGLNLTYKMPGMYFDLSGDVHTVPDVEVKEAYDDLSEWIKPLREGFPSNDNCEVYRKLNADLLQKGESKLRHFSLYRENEAISSGTLFLSDHAVMLHNLATKNKFRKCGIGSALTLYMMSEAKKAGYKHCFLDSSDEGFNLYSRLGFKVYCITSVYERYMSVPT
jgi:hypothetical protein